VVNGVKVVILGPLVIPLTQLRLADTQLTEEVVGDLGDFLILTDLEGEDICSVPVVVDNTSLLEHVLSLFSGAKTLVPAVLADPFVLMQMHVVDVPGVIAELALFEPSVVVNVLEVGDGTDVNTLGARAGGVRVPFVTSGFICSVVVNSDSTGCHDLERLVASTVRATQTTETVVICHD
jgi:hypothetical protein